MRYTLFVCADGTLTYGPHGQPSFNGHALPVYVADSEGQAKFLQTLLGKLQYTAHPKMPGQPWYCLSGFDGTVESLPAVTAKMEQYAKLYKEPVA